MVHVSGRKEADVCTCDRQSVIAWQAVLASGGYLTATILQGLVINSQPTYTPQRWHGTLLVIAIIAVCLVFNTFLARWLPKVESAVLMLHITLFIIVLVVLTVMSPNKSSSADVWALFLNAGGYESKGLSFFVGLITPVFAFSGADGAVHMSEEIRNSSRVVPWAMMSMCDAPAVVEHDFADVRDCSVYSDQWSYWICYAHRYAVLYWRHRRRTRHAHGLPRDRNLHAGDRVDWRRHGADCMSCGYVFLRDVDHCGYCVETTMGICAR
jgi:hypothetical protein